MRFHPLLTDQSHISDATRRFVETSSGQGAGDARFNSLCDAVVKHIAFMVDTNEAVGKIAELKALIDSLGSTK